MAAGPLGINLAGSLGFVDLMKQAQAFTSLTSTPLATDSNDWPLGDASVLIFDQRLNQPWNGPDPGAVTPDIGGTYHLSFQGQATVSPDWPGNYTVQNQVYNAATNTTTADLVVPANAFPMMYIDFRNTVNRASSTGAGVSNVKLIQPGYAADTTQVFTNAIQQGLSPFSTVRYLNIDQANNYVAKTDASGNVIPVEWSQRKLPSDASQFTLDAAPGQAWEYMIALANATNTDMWINVPSTASDSYVAQLASLIQNGDTVNGVRYAGLNPNLKVYLEYSNEVWGGIYNNFASNVALTRQQLAAGNSPLANDGTTDTNILQQRNYLQRSMQITNIFRSVMGSDPTYGRLRPVVAWQQGNAYFYQSNFIWFKNTYGTPSQYFYGMGNAMYSDGTDFSSVDNLLASVTKDFATQYANTQLLATVANYYGLNVLAYEGGPTSTGGTNSAQTQVALAAQRDPRMEQIIQQEYSTWFAAGGNLTMVYDGPFENWTPNNQYAIYEVAQANKPTASAKFRGFVDLRQAAPQAVTAGTLVSATAVTSVSTAIDSYNQPFPTYSPKQPNYWLLNVPTAGNYTLQIQTAVNSPIGQITVSLSDKATIGTYMMGASGTYNVAALSLHAGLNTLSISTASTFTPTALSLIPATTTVAAGPLLGDGGFEQVGMGSGPASYAYDPTGSAWAFAGQSGLTGNGSAFTSANPSAPQGSQAAFLQNQGSFGQTVSGFAAGSYRVAFAAAQRANYQAQTFQVLVDGSVVGTFTPGSTAYQSLATGSFAVTAGSHAIAFRGLNAAGDATAFIDGVSITQDTTTPTPASTNGLNDGSFETAQLPGNGQNNYVARPTGTPWVFTAGAGVAGPGSAWTNGNPNTPMGSQVGFIQTQGAISQYVTGLAAGNYAISFLIAQRKFNAAPQTVQVWVDGTVVGSFTPSGTSFTSVTTASFNIPAGAHEITFQGLVSGQDASALVDGISLNRV